MINVKRFVLLLVFLLVQHSHADLLEYEQGRVEELGKAIYQQDMVVADATDFLFMAAPGIDKSLLRGWIVESEKGETLVRFLREKGEGLEAYYDVIVREGRKPELINPKDRQLSERQYAQAYARNLALQNLTERCSEHYNTVLLPEPDGEGMLVYLLAASMNPDEVMLGGHYRFLISKDGKEIKRKDKLFVSCVTQSKKLKDAPPGAVLAAIYGSIAVGKKPLETHIYLNLLHTLTLYLINSERDAWRLEKGKITSLGKVDTK